MHGEFEFEVESEVYRTDDPKLSGRDIRTLSGHDPAANFRLIQIQDRYTSSVGLEDRVDLEMGRRLVFRIFEADRDFDFTVDDLGWEWGAASISEADIRKYGQIANDRDLVLEGKDEHIIPRGSEVDLAAPRVERIYSRKIKPVTKFEITFVINGEPQKVKAAPDDRLMDVLEVALKESENTGQPVDAWQVTDEPGKVLDLGQTLAEIGVHNGAVLVASLKTGAAG
jgi:hypothetical protein